MKIRKIILASSIVLLSISVYIFLAEYSASDITAENYSKILEQDMSQNIFYSGTTSFIYNDFFLTDASKIVNPETPERKLGWFDFAYYDNNNMKRIEIIDSISHVGYTINYENGISYGYSVYDQAMRQPSPKIQEYVKILMQKNDLTVRRSNERSYDLLIQETKHDFIIYTIQGHLEAPFSIWVQRYAKKKYLTSIRKIF